MPQDPSIPDPRWAEWFRTTSARVSAWMGASSLQQLTVVAEAQRARATGTSRATRQQADAYTDMVRRINSLWATAITATVNMISRDFSAAVTRLAGTQGGLGQTGIMLGGMMGKTAGRSIGGYLAGDSGKKIGAVFGASAGRAIIGILQTAEAVRVVGARFAPMMTGGMSGRRDYFHMGADLISKQAALQMVTTASQQQIIEYGQHLARLGIGFAQGGADATQMALASEQVLMLSPGSVIQVMSQAVAEQGQRWQDTGKIIEQVATASEQWRRVASMTGSSIAASLGANQTMLNIYKGVAGAARGTSLDLVGLTNASLGLANTMGKMGLRPGQIAALTTDVAKLLTPQVNSITGMYTQSFFLTDILQRTASGRAQFSQLQNIAIDKGYDPSAIAMPLMFQMASNSTATEETYRNIILGVGATRDAMASTDMVSKNLLTQQKMEKQFGVSPLFSRAMITMHDTYQDFLEKGYSPEEAWRRAGAAPVMKEALGTIGPGVSIESIIKQAAELGSAGLTVEQRLSLSAQTWTGLFGDGRYWSGLETHGKGLYEAAAERILSGVEPKRAARVMTSPGVGMTPPLQTDTGEEVPSGAQVSLSDPDALRKALEMRRTTVGSTVKSTARGIEQTTTSAYSPYLEKYGAELGIDPNFLEKQAQVESSNRPWAVSPKGAMGVGQIMPTTWQMLAPRIQARFPGEKISPFDPKYNLYAQSLYMHDLLQRTGGDYERAAEMYNAGPKGNPNNPETRAYIQKIFGSGTPISTQTAALR